MTNDDAFESSHQGKFGFGYLSTRRQEQLQSKNNYQSRANRQYLVAGSTSSNPKIFCCCHDCCIKLRYYLDFVFYLCTYLWNHSALHYGRSHRVLSKRRRWPPWPQERLSLCITLSKAVTGINLWAADLPRSPWTLCLERLPARYPLKAALLICRYWKLDMGFYLSHLTLIR